MDGRPVLVATEYEDATADLVITELNRRRVPVLRLDPGRDFPSPAVLTASTGTDGWGGRLTIGERTADLGQVRVLYHRRPSNFAPLVDGQAARFAAQENRRGFGGLLGALPGCRYLSHPQAIARAEYKPAQLAAATHAGLPVPATLITNDPKEAKSFATAQPTIYKPLHAGAYDVDGEPAGIWAAPVEPGQIDAAVGHCAHLFQAQVDKTCDVRAVVVGEEVMCARITAPVGVVDWRAEYRSLSYEATECPDEIRGPVLQFLASFGLAFGAFDFAVTSDGAWWFLECNPNGQWAWLEDAVGLPITAAIADLLENGDNK
ncbi:ATP-grasp ribosomal peptide maturase [Streptantibioticus ferralitis]|uniref:ATP-grasp ribosomal peptide maturase n=1 Tax=Streptantibioticus ferralitis TaxID=236510 RepID=A0ABT5ZC58_9ACTN|nr:ATP-grasp ribosomal peptide maturase [Streptantibioticus ferralitis]MDF2261425.1 ATP-grasp ribosomal peptide maturase [Streptantibioticus ferralitis]